MLAPARLILPSLASFRPAGAWPNGSSFGLHDLEALLNAALAAKDTSQRAGLIDYPQPPLECLTPVPFARRVMVRGMKLR